MVRFGDCPSVFLYHLINRIQDNLDDHRDFSFESRVHTQEEFEPWVEEFREVLLNRLKIKDLLENRGEIQHRKR